jgi:hypothetical protein
MIVMMIRFAAEGPNIQHDEQAGRRACLFDNQAIMLLADEATGHLGFGDPIRREVGPGTRTRWPDPGYELDWARSALTCSHG